jgi:hypothetical protein
VYFGFLSVNFEIKICTSKGKINYKWDLDGLPLDTLAPKLLAAVAPSLPAGANLFLQTFRPPSPRRLFALLHHAPTDVDAQHLLDGTPRRTRAISIVRPLRDGLSPRHGRRRGPPLHVLQVRRHARPARAHLPPVGLRPEGANVCAALALFDEVVEPDIILYISPPTNNNNMIFKNNNNKNMFGNWLNDIDKITKIRIRIGVSPLY